MEFRNKDGKILYNEEVAPGYFKLGLSWKTPEIHAGQFVMLRVSDGLDPLLRRPLGIYNVLGGKGIKVLKGSGIELLYRVVGKGTKILSEKREGEKIGVLGPLGNGFPEPGEARKIIMVAGGMGIVPLYMLARKLNTGVLLFGARGKSEAGLVKSFKEFKCKIKVSTEDGSIGRKGLVTELLNEEVVKGSLVYACGPIGMLKAVANIARNTEARCYVSLERSMACGIGVCLGCAVKSAPHDKEENKDYRMVCSDGPVFDSNEIDWDKL